MIVGGAVKCLSPANPDYVFPAGDDIREQGTNLLSRASR